MSWAIIGILYNVTDDFYFIANIYREDSTVINGEYRELPNVLHKKSLGANLVIPIKGTQLNVSRLKYSLGEFHHKYDIDLLTKHGMKK